MKNKLLSLLILSGLVVVLNPVLAIPAEFPANDNSQAIVSLGKAFDPGTGKIVEGIAIIDYKKGHAKPNGVGNGKKGGGASSTCYAFLANGAKWNKNEGWVVNSANSGLNADYVFDTLTNSIGKWEDAAGANVFGDGVLTSDTLEYDQSTPLDNVNEVYFDEISEQGVIAVTYVWGIFSGPPQLRELVEWDMVFNTAYDWSSTGEVGKMDFENIATHELGHALGLGHPGDSCAEETMYRFAYFGETMKRDLNAGDIAGIGALY
ncbi:MAG: matrixin family metalloprotease [bacterium]|nr:matrixin family metalloprotease [bacterium]